MKEYGIPTLSLLDEITTNGNANDYVLEVEDSYAFLWLGDLQGKLSRRLIAYYAMFVLERKEMPNTG